MQKGRRSPAYNKGNLSLIMDTPTLMFHKWVPTNLPKWKDKLWKKMVKIGKIIRKLSFEEAPQLLNIIKGNISIIGPRSQFVKGDL